MLIKKETYRGPAAQKTDQCFFFLLNSKLMACSVTGWTASPHPALPDNLTHVL